MRLRALSSFLALAALVAAGVTFSGAVFTAASANPGNAFTASNAFDLTATMNDPGANLRLTVSLSASASDGGDGSSITSVTVEKSPAGAGTWTTACSDTTAPYSCSFDTATISDGLYDFRAVAQNDAGGSATSATVTNRRVDNTDPTAGMTDPGTPLRATITLDATGGDPGGSGVAGVTIQRSPAGAGTWTDVCTDASSPYSCSFDTTTVSDGLYDFRAVATDNSGKTSASTVANRTIDNTAPTAVDIQTTNGGTAGRPDANDTITFTYSEQLLTTSILAGWDGTATAVTARINNQGANDRLEIWNAGNTALLPLTDTFVTLNGNYVTASTTFNATMVQNGASITITLGTQTAGTVRTENGTGAMSWPSSAAVTDIAGNACTGNAVAESGAGDTDF